MKVLKNSRGNALSEYGLLLSLMVVGSIALLVAYREDLAEILSQYRATLGF